MGKYELNVAHVMVELLVNGWHRRTNWRHIYMVSGRLVVQKASSVVGCKEPFFAYGAACIYLSGDCPRWAIRIAGNNSNHHLL
jgi:hypothetical protein